MRSNLFSAALLSLPLALAAHAGEVTLTPLGGYQDFSHKLDNLDPPGLDNSFIYGASLGYRFDPQWSTELEYLHSGPARHDVSGKGNDDFLALNGLYRFTTRSRWEPYVLLGAGGQRLRVRGLESTRNAVINAGAGLFYRISDSVRLRGELRAAGDVSKHYTDGVALVGLEISLGGSGTSRAVAAAPIEAVSEPASGQLSAIAPEPVPPPAVALTPPPATASATAPAPKKAAATAQEKEEPVLIPQQFHPAAPVAAAQPDRDGDGVPDVFDKCPDTPQGVKVDSRGCPVVISEAIRQEVKVLFDNGQAVIKPQYQDEVRKVAELARAYPRSHIEIEGYTDNTGDAARNLRLSRARADAVRDSLVRNFGVASSRLGTRGLGEHDPVADNRTEEGRARNRRVVAVISAERKEYEKKKPHHPQGASR